MQQIREFPGLPTGGLPRFDPCAEYRLLPQQRVQEQRNPSAHGGTGRSYDRIPVTANRFAAATEEIAGCKSGHALAPGLKWVSGGNGWGHGFEDRGRHKK